MIKIWKKNIEHKKTHVHNYENTIKAVFNNNVSHTYDKLFTQQ